MLRGMREHTSPHPPFVRSAAQSGPSLSVGLRVAMVLGALALAVSLVAPGLVLAAKPTLSNGTVSPATGTTTTTFVFSVTYTGSKPASSVVALVANRTIPLSLVSAATGQFRGSSLLPAGSWLVVFQATVPGADAQENGPTVLVTPASPTPTPQPTAPPTPVATATPAPTSTRVPTLAPSAIAATPFPSAVASPSASSGGPSGSGEPTPFGTTVAGESGTGLVSASPSAAPSAGDGDVEQQLSTFLTGGVVAVGLLGAIGFAAIYADRRRRAAESPAAGPPGAQSPQSTAPARARSSRTGGWEDYALDNEPIGTVEPEPPPTDE